MKLVWMIDTGALDAQPPSGGCVLKLRILTEILRKFDPAAFGRLCVETGIDDLHSSFFLTSRLRAAVC